MRVSALSRSPPLAPSRPHWQGHRAEAGMSASAAHGAHLVAVLIEGWLQAGERARDPTGHRDNTDGRQSQHISHCGSARVARRIENDRSSVLPSPLFGFYAGFVYTALGWHTAGVAGARPPSAHLLTAVNVLHLK